MAPDLMSKLFTELFDAERLRRKAEISLAKADRSAVLAVAKAEVAGAASLTQDERDLRLSQIADVLSTHDGNDVVDLLIDILGATSEEGRFCAGRGLQELAFERFKEVALGIERAVKRLPGTSPALRELPFAIATVPEPGVVKLFGLFLGHADAEVVASAIEAAMDRGDPELIKPLEKLIGDKRRVSMDDETGEVDEVTLGQLAEEAVEELAASFAEEDEA